MDQGARGANESLYRNRQMDALYRIADSLGRLYRAHPTGMSIRLLSGVGVEWRVGAGPWRPLPLRWTVDLTLDRVSDEEEG